MEEGKGPSKPLSFVVLIGSPLPIFGQLFHRYRIGLLSALRQKKKRVIRESFAAQRGSQGRADSAAG
jgi:hypothetical protein